MCFQENRTASHIQVLGRNEFENFETSNASELLAQVKKVSDYNTNGVNKVEYPNNEQVLNKNPSNLSNISLYSGDNIKMLNEYQNNIEERIQNLKNKIEKNKINKLNFEKFKNLKNNSLTNILYFLDSNSFMQMFSMNKQIKEKILEILIELSYKIVKSFEMKYSNNFKIESKYITLKKILKNKKITFKIDLIIKSTVISENLINKSVIICYISKFPCDKDSFKNYFKFDIESTGPLSYWIMREYTNVFLI
jgi:hypothetical protein